MKEGRLGRKDFIRMVIILLMACFFLYSAWISGHQGNWVRFSICLATYTIFAIWLPSILIRQKIDERFDRLEKLLGKKDQGEKQEKIIKQDTDKSAEA